jgi:hypothetical protein
MMFEEHRAFLPRRGNLKASISELKQRTPEQAIMIEVTSEAEAFNAAEAMADVIQPEKFGTGGGGMRSAWNPQESRWPPGYLRGGRCQCTKCWAQNAGGYAKAGADGLLRRRRITRGPWTFRSA